MHKRFLLLSLLAALVLTGCGGKRPGKYKLTSGLGTYYVDAYSNSSGCTTFRYYIGNSLKGYRQICDRVNIEVNK